MNAEKAIAKDGIHIVIEPRTFDFPVARVSCSICGKMEELVEANDIDTCELEHLNPESEFSLIDSLIEKLEYLGWKELEIRQVNPSTDEDHPKSISVWICPNCQKR